MSIVIKAVKNTGNEIDLALSIMCSISKYDETLSTKEIADICGCSQTLISHISRQAIKKLQGNAGIKLRGYL